MTTGTTVRRLLLLFGLLVAGVLAWWAFPNGGGGSGDAVTRGPEGGASPLPLGEQPVLRGAPDAETSAAPVERGTPASSDEATGPWRITFDVISPEGRPWGWTDAMLLAGDGVELAQALYGDPVSSGWLRAPGPGRLVVFSPEFRPWASEPLTRPATGDEQHVVVRLDPGLVVAGEVLCQGGRTPVRDGTVVVRGRHRLHPEAVPEFFSLERRVLRGEFRLAGLAPGKVEVVASSRGWGDGRPVRVEVDAGTEDLRLVLAPQVIVRVLVVDGATGFAPVTPRVRVERLDEEGRTTRRSETTTTEPEEGREPTPIAIVDAEPGETLRFRAEAVGYRTREQIVFDVPRTGTRFTARIELEPDPESVCHVRLRPLFEGGPPPESVLVAFRDRPAHRGHAYALDGEPIRLELAPGQQVLRVGRATRPSPAGIDWVPVDLDLDLEPGEERDVEVVLRPGGWVLLVGRTALRPKTVLWSGREGERATQASWSAVGETTGHLLGLLPPGAWAFRFGKGGQVLRGRVDVRVGEVVHVDASMLEVVEGEEAGR